MQMVRWFYKVNSTSNFFSEVRTLNMKARISLFPYISDLGYINAATANIKTSSVFYVALHCFVNGSVVLWFFFDSPLFCIAWLNVSFHIQKNWFSLYENIFCLTPCRELKEMWSMQRAFDVDFGFWIRLHIDKTKNSEVWFLLKTKL